MSSHDDLPQVGEVWVFGPYPHGAFNTDAAEIVGRIVGCDPRAQSFEVYVLAATPVARRTDWWQVGKQVNLSFTRSRHPAQPVVEWVYTND